MDEEQEDFDMKAPDKIYVDYGLIDYHCLDEQKVDSIEYIRKDAILEWAEKKLQARHAPQFRDAIGQLIDKLESL